MNLEAVELGRAVVACNHGFNAVHRSGGLRDVDDAREERRGAEGGWRPIARRPVCPPAVHSFDYGTTPHLALEQRVFGKHQDPLCDRGWVGVKRNADVARCSLARHGWDMNESGGNDEGDMVERSRGWAVVGLLCWTCELDWGMPF
jgi:hypothetical protein